MNTEKLLRAKKGNDIQKSKGVEMSKITNENFANSKLDINLLIDIDALIFVTQNLIGKEFIASVDDIKIKVTFKSWEITKSKNANLSNEDLNKCLSEINKNFLAHKPHQTHH